MKATDQQVRYLMLLLGKAGYSTRYMNAEYKRLGASMRERSGSVEYWLRSRTIAEASQLIQTLQKEAS